MQKPKAPSPSTTPAKTTADTAAPLPTPAAAATAQRQNAMNAIRDTYQKNFAALTQATQTLTTGAASVFQRQQDLLRNSMAQAASTAQQRVATVAPQQCPEALDRYKQALDVGLANSRKIADLAEQSKKEAFDTIQKHMADRFHERAQLTRNAAESPPGTTASPSTTKS